MVNRYKSPRVLNSRDHLAAVKGTVPITHCLEGCSGIPRGGLEIQNPKVLTKSNRNANWAENV